MSYNDYKQQYAYGFAPVALADLGALDSASDKFFLGENFGPKANLSKSTNDSTHTKPIDFKAGKQMFHKKALLDVEVIESIAPLGHKQSVKLTLSSAVGTAGAHTITIKDETPVVVEAAASATAAAEAALVATALAGLKNWDVSYTATNAYVTLTRKVAAENWTYSDTTKFKFETTAGTQTGAWSQPEGETGVAPNADAHSVLLEFKSVNTEDDIDAYVAGSLTVDPDMAVYVKPGDAVVCNTPYFQSLMPSNTKRFSWVEISCPYSATSSITFTAGKLLIHCNPN